MLALFPIECRDIGPGEPGIDRSSELGLAPQPCRERELPELDAEAAPQLLQRAKLVDLEQPVSAVAGRRAARNDQTCALEAVMDGYEVLPMARAAEIGDIFVTATGDKAVITREHMERMKDGAALANTGHFNVEIELPALRSLAVETRTLRQFVDEFRLEDGRRLYLIADGRLVNLSAAEGHPAQVMDMSFANQALSAEYVVANAASLERRVYSVPAEIDDGVARLKLETMGVAIDHLTEEQAKYLASWDEGT